METKQKFKTAIMEMEQGGYYVDEYGEHIQDEADYPSKFVGYDKACPSCDGDAGIVCRSEEGDYVEGCDYCHGRGYIDCSCGNDANFSTEMGHFCWDCLDQEHKDAFIKENPSFKPMGEDD